MLTLPQIGVYAIYSFTFTNYYRPSALSDDVDQVSRLLDTAPILDSIQTAFTSTSHAVEPSTVQEEVSSTSSASSTPSPSPPAPVIDGPENANMTHRANATLLMLARNSELVTAINSVRELEDKFNQNYGYPWVFLNEVPFSDEFKQ